MNNVSIFNFETNEVRTLTDDRDGSVWFVGKDVAEVLGYTDTDYAIRTHCKAVNTYADNSSGQVRHVKIIPERDLYRLIMRSKKAEAEKFEEWVVSEVLPSIRKTGGYIADKKSVTPGSLEDKLKAANVIADMLNLTGSAKVGALRRTVALMDSSLLPMIPDYAIDAPVIAGESASTSEVCFSMTELLKRNGSPISTVKANKILIDCGLLEEKTRPSRSGSGAMKKFKCITKAGLAYGKNVVSEQNPRETQPQWFESKFQDLLDNYLLSE